MRNIQEDGLGALGLLKEENTGHLHAWLPEAAPLSY